MHKYVKAKYIQERFEISSNTLRTWGAKGKLKMVRLPDSKQRLYDYNHFTKIIGMDEQEVQNKENYCYARVSSSHQKEDLERQAESLQLQFPHHKIVKEVGSGLNWNRKGLRTILEQIVKRNVGEIVVAHKDRLCRFGFELLEWLCKEFGCKIVVLDETTETNPEIELSKDVLAIINFFTAKNNGMRSAANRRKKKQTIQSKKNKVVSKQKSEEETL